MKYTLNLDTNNYVLSIAHTSNDNIELDLSTIDLTYLSAYQYLNGELVLDEVKKQAMIGAQTKQSKEEQINKLKEELTSTDYKIIKCSEYQLAQLEPPYDIAKLHAIRQSLRDKINELESE